MDLEKKQDYYRLSQERKQQGWEPERIPTQENTVSRHTQEEMIFMNSMKFGTTGPGEPSYLPPVITLPGHIGCEDILLMSTLKAQDFEETYEAETGLERGTIFPELDLPFLGKGGTRHDR